MKKKWKALVPFTATGGQKFELDEMFEATEEEAKGYLEHGLIELIDEEAEENEAAIEAKIVAAVERLVAPALAKGFQNAAAKHISVTQDEVDKLASGFKNVGEQLACIKAAGATQGAVMDKRLIAIEEKAATGLNEGVDSEGGFLIGEDFTTDLVQELFETGKLMAKAQTVEISSNANRLTWVAVKDDNRTAGNRRGGVVVNWTDEAGTKGTSKPKFEKRGMDLEKQTGLFYATDEQLQDSTALASMVSTWFVEEFGFSTDEAMLRGTGAGQPKGIIGAASTREIAAEGGQAADTVVTANIEKMWTAMRPASLPFAEWLINMEVWTQLFKLQRTVGTGGLPVFMPPTGLEAAPFGMLLGRPIIVIEQCSALGDVGDIIFADFGQYLMIRKGGIQTATSIHVRFVNDETAFRFTMRLNGQPKARATTTPARGANKTSPFVTLANRA